MNTKLTERLDALCGAVAGYDTAGGATRAAIDQEVTNIRADILGEFSSLRAVNAELLKALKHMVITCEQCWGNGHYYDKHDDKIECQKCKRAHAAIAKATGA